MMKKLDAQKRDRLGKFANRAPHDQYRAADRPPLNPVNPLAMKRPFSKPLEKLPFDEAPDFGVQAQSIDMNRRAGKAPVRPTKMTMEELRRIRNADLSNLNPQA